MPNSDPASASSRRTAKSVSAWPSIQPDNSYQMSGNQISVKTLDLNRDFSEIATQLNAIVDKHFV